MLGRLIDFIIYVVVALIVGFVLVLVVGILPVLPGEIKEVLKIVIWAIVAIAILLAARGIFLGTWPSFMNRPPTT